VEFLWIDGDHTYQQQIRRAGFRVDDLTQAAAGQGTLF